MFSYITNIVSTSSLLHVRTTRNRRIWKCHSLEMSGYSPIYWDWETILPYETYKGKKVSRNFPKTSWQSSKTSLQTSETSLQTSETSLQTSKHLRKTLDKRYKSNEKVSELRTLANSLSVEARPQKNTGVIPMDKDVHLYIYDTCEDDYGLRFPFYFFCFYDCIPLWG